MDYVVQIENSSYEIHIDADNGQLTIGIDDRIIPVTLNRIGASNIYSFLIENSSFDFEINYNNTDYLVLHHGYTYLCRVEDKRLAQIKRMLGTSGGARRDSELRSPMPGLVTEIRVKVGDEVKAGAGVIVVEAMKMENELRVKSDGRVKSLHVKEKQSVDQNQVLMEFE